VPAGGEQVATSSNPRYFTGKVNITQLTKGNWQVEWAKWSAADRIILMSSQGGSAERSFYQFLTASNTLQGPINNVGGFDTNPQLAENEGDIRTLIFDSSKWDRPDEVIATSSCNVKCELKSPVQLTRTTPDAFLKQKWSEPKFIDIPSRDGKKIKSKIYLPTGFDKTKKYPMVIFVHGAGYLQNVINGWNNYYREFMFNELLTQKGYVVLDIDYRGSAGYGREWRTDVYDFLGGKDYDDELDALDFMIKNYAVDAKRVGVYGGSYGGFMAEMLAFRAPEKIAAAAALRPVADWKNYYASSPDYTAQRLGFPDKNPEAYKRSSPITYADGLKTHLLILHGMSDTNVHVQDSMQLVEKLVRLGKTPYFETMFYPSENHGFERPESWTDEYERILAFFEKYLK
jgi:dipeptidyl aminopeptidase/acylaminoacyl peptidase